MENYRVFEITRDYPACIAKNKMETNLADEPAIPGSSSVRTINENLVNKFVCPVKITLANCNVRTGSTVFANSDIITILSSIVNSQLARP